MHTDASELKGVSVTILSLSLRRRVEDVFWQAWFSVRHTHTHTLSHTHTQTLSVAVLGRSVL